MSRKRSSSFSLYQLLFAALGWVVCLHFVFPFSAHGQVEIEVTRKVDPITVAIVPLDRGKGSLEDTELSKTIEDVLRYDLEFSDYFDFVSNRSWIVETHEGDKELDLIDYAEWKRLGAEAIVKGVYDKDEKNVSLDMLLISVSDQKVIVGKNYSFPVSEVRRVAHMFSDEIAQKYTNQPGIAQTKIAFVNFRNGIKEIYVMDYDGHPDSVKRITYDNNLALFPSWSPDSTQLAFMSYKNKNPDLYLFDFTTGLFRHFLGHPGINTAPAWHPEGHSLAVTLSKDGNAEIYTASPRGASLKRLTKNPAGDCSPCWSPSGNELAFTSDRYGRPHIFVMNADGSNVRKITSGAWQDDNSCWSPDGKWITYCSSAGRNFNIYLVSPDGYRIVQLTRSKGSNESPFWAPDGRHIVFSSTREGPSQIYVMDADGSDVRRLTYLPGDNQTPSWSPGLRK